MPNPPIARRNDGIAAAILCVCGLSWLWFAGRHKLGQDESYYWQWSRHLAAGYYDNTPGMAYVIRFFTLIFGNTEIGVRAGAVACACVAAWFLYKLADELFGRATALIALVIALINPLFGDGATLMSADPPLLCCWTLCAWASHRAIRTERGKTAWGWWLLSGILAGLTGLSKLNGLLILPSVLLYLAIEPSARRWLTRPQPYVAAALALLVFSPFIWWNHTHGDAFSLHIHTMGTRTEAGQGKITLKYLGEFLGAQAILISPLLFLTYLWTLFTGLTRAKMAGNAGAGIRYCWCLAVVFFIATVVVSLQGRVEGNWSVASYITGLILAAQLIESTWQRASARRWHIASAALAAFLTLFSYYSTLTSFGPRIKALDKKTDEIYGWRTMAARVAQEERAMGDNPFVFGVNYRMPSELAFYLPGQPETYSLFLKVRANEYMFWETSGELVGRDAIMVNDTDTPDHLTEAQAVFRNVVVEPPLKVYRAGIAQPIRTIQIFRCYGFKGYRREEWQDGW